MIRLELKLGLDYRLRIAREVAPIDKGTLWGGGEIVVDGYSGSLEVTRRLVSTEKGLVTGNGQILVAGGREEPAGLCVVVEIGSVSMQAVCCVMLCN